MPSPSIVDLLIDGSCRNVYLLRSLIDAKLRLLRTPSWSYKKKKKNQQNKHKLDSEFKNFEQETYLSSKGFISVPEENPASLQNIFF